MRRILAGVAAALLFTGAAILWWRGQADAESIVPPAPAALADRADGAAASAPPTATEQTREERRFGRYDKDRDGGITRDEYLVSRRKAYAKLDADGDGRLTFDEWAVKTSDKFAKADADGTAVLTPAEFWTTRVIRKTKPRPDCPPVRIEED